MKLRLEFLSLLACGLATAMPTTALASNAPIPKGGSACQAEDRGRVVAIEKVDKCEKKVPADPNNCAKENDEYLKAQSAWERCCNGKGPFNSHSPPGSGCGG